MVLSENCGSSNFLIVEKSNEPMIQQFSNAWEKIIFKLWPSWASYLAPWTKPRGIMAGVRERECESVSVCERERERKRKKERGREREIKLVLSFSFILSPFWSKHLVIVRSGAGLSLPEVWVAVKIRMRSKRAPFWRSELSLGHEKIKKCYSTSPKGV